MNESDSDVEFKFNQNIFLLQIKNISPFMKLQMGNAFKHTTIAFILCADRDGLELVDDKGLAWRVQVDDRV